MTMDSTTEAVKKETRGSAIVSSSLSCNHTNETEDEEGTYIEIEPTAEKQKQKQQARSRRNLQIYHHSSSGTKRDLTSGNVGKKLSMTLEEL